MKHADIDAKWTKGYKKPQQLLENSEKEYSKIQISGRLQRIKFTEQLS